MSRREIAPRNIVSQSSKNAYANIAKEKVLLQDAKIHEGVYGHIQDLDRSIDTGDIVFDYNHTRAFFVNREDEVFGRSVLNQLPIPASSENKEYELRKRIRFLGVATRPALYNAECPQHSGKVDYAVSGQMTLMHTGDKPMNILDKICLKFPDFDQKSHRQNLGDDSLPAELRKVMTMPYRLIDKTAFKAYDAKTYAYAVLSNTIGTCLSASMPGYGMEALLSPAGRGNYGDDYLKSCNIFEESNKILIDAIKNSKNLDEWLKQMNASVGNDQLKEFKTKLLRDKEMLIEKMKQDDEFRHLFT